VRLSHALVDLIFMYFGKRSKGTNESNQTKKRKTTRSLASAYARDSHTFCLLVNPLPQQISVRVPAARYGSSSPLASRGSRRLRVGGAQSLAWYDRTSRRTYQCRFSLIHSQSHLLCRLRQRKSSWPRWSVLQP